MDTTVTVDLIKTTAPDLASDLRDDTIQALIDNACLIALGDRFPKSVTLDGEVLPLRDMATRDMALHLMFMQTSAGSHVTSEKVDVLEVHYADTTKLDWLNSSPYGQAYLRLYNEWGGGSQIRYGVVDH